MKVHLLISMMLFSNVAFADDFFNRYLKESADCEEQAKQMQMMSTYFHCVVGALETVKADPFFHDAQDDANLLIGRFNKRAEAWERYESFQISKSELDTILHKIDTNE